MKKIFLLPFLFLIVACSLTHHTVTIGVLTLPARPRVNKHIKIRYDVDSIVLANKKNLQITLYYVVKGKIYAVPVALSHTRKRVKASFRLPDSAQAFALRPQEQYVLVSKKNGYISAVYDHAGKPVAGALAGMSLFYNAIGEDDIGSSLLDRPVDADTALKMMQADFAAHPEIKHRWMGTYLNTLLTARKQAAHSEIESALQQMLSPDDVQPGDYVTAYNLFLRMDRWNKADSVMIVGALKFPTGLMAKLAAESRFSFLQESMDSMLVHYQNFKQMFPVTDTLSASAEIQDRMLGKIAFQYAEQEDYQKYMAFISLIKNPVLKARAYHYRAGKLMEAGKNLPFADSISRMSLDLIKQSMRHPEQGKQTYQTGEDREKEMQQLYARYADTYASLLNKEGKVKDAAAYQKQAVEYFNGEYSLMNEHYMQYLMDLRDYKSAQNQLEEFIVKGETTDKLDNYLKPLYIHLNESETGYADYHRKLEKKAEAMLKVNLPKEMVDEPASDFTLPDLKGKQVSLAALKGKVVVLYFWSTWCPPCKASLPGMQKVVDNFRSDSNIVFLFVNTLEETGAEQRHKQVSDFIANHNYTFHVLLDQHKADDSTRYQVINDYKVIGIPTKFVIGPRGHIRFWKLGFSGSTPAEVRELSMMIDIAGRQSN